MSDTPSRSEMKIIDQAVRHGWPVPADAKEEAVVQLRTVLATAEKDRDRVAAARVLVAMEGQNMEQTKRDAVGFGETHNVHVSGGVLVAAATEETIAKATDELARWREQMKTMLSSSPSAPPTPPTSPTPTA